MSYEHIILDDEGAELCITAQPEIEAPILLRSAVSTHAVTFEVPTHEAPALALAILKAANIPDDQGDVHGAISNLIYHERNRAEKAEREAEDAKVKAYRDALFPAAIKWEHLDEEIRETHRARYRTAREFFAREEIIPADVVDEPVTVETVNDLEEIHEWSEWRDREGCLWTYVRGAWGWRSGALAPRRVAVPESFPWTEVL